MSNKESVYSIFNWLANRWVEVIGVLALIGILIDYLNPAIQVVTPALGYAGEHKTGLTVVISGLLFYAYLLQYRTAERQRGIMDTQTELMEAGYTPLLGVIQRELTNEIGDSSFEEEQMRVNISNQGNSLAKSLAVYFAVEYDEQEAEEGVSIQYTSHRSTLEQVGDEHWWRSSEGAVIPEATENKPYYTGISLTAEDGEEVPFRKAASSLYDDGIETLRIACTLQYENAKGDSSEIGFAAYRADLERMEQFQYKLSHATELQDRNIEEILENSECKE